jgi:hypothetical protein
VTANVGEPDTALSDKPPGEPRLGPEDFGGLLQGQEPVNSRVAATEQIGRFLRSQILRDISRARQRVDRPALSGALGGSPGGAVGHG